MRPLLSFTIVLALYTSSISAQPHDSWGDALGASIEDQWTAAKYRSFDFWIGEWDANWRGKPAGAFYHQQEGSRTHGRVFPILGGKALVELEWPRDNPDQAGQVGFSIRYYDPARKRWIMAQSWPNQNSQGSAFMDQLIGDEHLGRLAMYSITQRPKKDGTLDTQHRRYNFTDIQPGKSFRWDGSNTRDKAATWNTWAIVDFLRLRALDPYGAAGTPFPGVHQEALCTGEPHGAYDSLQGVWEGTATDADGIETPARLSAGKVLDGCGVAMMLETSAMRRFMALGYSERFKHWVSFRLDDLAGTTHSYFVSKTSGAGAVFAQAPALTIKDEFTPYLLPASFNTGAALKRTVWDAFGDDEIVLREELRDNAKGAWRMATTYRLSRR